MINKEIEISSKPIKLFLDAVDIVLNSITFLLQFDVKNDSIYQAVSEFLSSESFINQLTKQDKERGWFNLHYFDEETESFQIKSGNILEEIFELKMEEISNKKNEYLTAMLTCDTTKGRFRSFYDKQINKEDAKLIVNDFTSFLCTKNDWKLFFVAPNFLKETNKKYSENENLRYFEGINGNDSATLILTNDKGFLLLTNGID